jgi:hypothetical protein
MERSHGICVLLSGYQYNGGSSIANFLRFKSDESRYRNVFPLHVCHKPSLMQVAGALP